jgi:hypothetical protein
MMHLRVLKIYVTVSQSQIIYDVTGLQLGDSVTVSGTLPSNVITSFINNGDGTGTVTLTGSGQTNYWNVREFPL